MPYLKQSPFSFTAKVLVLLFVFGLFPVFVTVVAVNYKNKVEAVLEARNPQADQLFAQDSLFDTGAAKILTEDQADTLKRVGSFMVGKWASLQDKNYTVEMLQNGTFIDKDGDSLVAYGTWSSFVSATSSSNIRPDAAGSQGIAGSYSVGGANSSYYLKKTHSEEKYRDQKFVYEIMRLDQDRAILYYTGNSKMLYFARDTAGASSSADRL